MPSFVYPARVRRDEAGFYLVTFPDVPRCATDGRTRDEALREAADALEEAIAHRIAQGLEIPVPPRIRKGQSAVALSAHMSAKAALYLAVRESGIRRSDLARRLGISEAEVRHMLNPRHSTKLSRIEEGLAALGKRLIVHTEAA